MAIPLNMGGSCSVCVPLYITKRSEAVLQWGKRKNIKKMIVALKKCMADNSDVKLHEDL